MFLFFEASRPLTEPTQPGICWVSVAYSLFYGTDIGMLY